MKIKSLFLVIFLLATGGSLCAQINNGGSSSPAGAASTYTDATLFGVKADGVVSCTIGTTNTSNVITDVSGDYTFQATDAGRNIFITNDNCASFSLTGVYMVANPARICTNVAVQAHQVSVCGADGVTANNATGTCANVCAALVWTHDDTAALNSAFVAATTVPICGRLQLPTGTIPVSAPIQSTQSCGSSTLIQPGVETVTVMGYGMAATTIVPLPTFDATNCTFAKGGCFFGISGAGTFSGPQFRDFAIFGLGQHTVTGGAGNFGIVCGVACSMDHIALTEWAGSSGGFTGLVTNGTGGGGASTINYIQNFEFGNPGFSFSGVVNANNIQVMGNPSVTGNSSNVVTANSFFSCNTGAAQCVNVGASANWLSIGDTCDILGGTPTCIVVPNTSQVNLVGATIQTSAAGQTGLKVNAGGIAHMEQSTITATATTSINNAGTFFDDGGNKIGNGVTNTGNYFRSASVTGTALGTGGVGLTSGWGTSTVATAVGDSHAGRFTITGAAGSASPTLTLTFPKTYNVAPATCTLQFTGTNTGLTSVTVGTPSTTTVLFTFVGTPQAVTYQFDYQCGP